MTTAMWVCIFVVVLASICDWWNCKIPNFITLGGFFTGIVIHGVIGAVDAGALGMLRGAGYSFFGAMACGLIPFLGWRKKQLGGGDVKLFAAVGALLGPFVGFDVQACAFALSVLVLFPYRLVRHGLVGLTVRNAGTTIANLFRRDDAKVPVDQPHRKVPAVVFAPTIAFAVLLTLVHHGALR
jgi:prepilin peptidase CpaA